MGLNSQCYSSPGLASATRTGEACHATGQGGSRLISLADATTPTMQRGLGTRLWHVWSSSPSPAPCLSASEKRAEGFVVQVGVMQL